jgi:hypothetical protein
MYQEEEEENQYVMMFASHFTVHFTHHQPMTPLATDSLGSAWEYDSKHTALP